MDNNILPMEICKYFPISIKQSLELISNKSWDDITEIRVNSNRSIIISTLYGRFYLTKNGLSKISSELIIANSEDLKIIIELITNSSVYSYSRYINQGFITLPGGNRVGLCGECVFENDKIFSVKNISYLNFRISHEKKGISKDLIDEIINDDDVNNSIIISPPGCGKTTLLRDISRQICITNPNLVCAIIDERYELSASFNGKPTLDVGINNFVISGCPKHYAIELVVRSMSPDIIVVDELCTSMDFESVKYALKSGCKFICTVHGKNENTNEFYDSDLKNEFKRIIVLSNKNGPGTIEKILKGW